MNQMFVETVINPFNLKDPPSQLVNFVSGVVVKLYVLDSLLDALNKGQEIADKCVNKQLIPVRMKAFQHNAFIAHWYAQV